MKKPELLLPAGSREALEAAIEGGADAVYLGGGRFNARMRAQNFSDDELKSAVSLASAYGVKSYITMNTRLYDNELSDALSLCAMLYGMGADAIIVADLGLASLIKKHIPELEIHASTQLSGHSVPDAIALRDAGFSRMVCHREITEEGLFDLCRRSPIEIEMFIHGAYCVSFSGQCLMSAVMGGRSGNRGECAQPCRQPYAKDGIRFAKDHPISLKDMCLASHMEDILRSGVASLKIEGRQKSAEYVLGVCRIYRRLIDEERNATEEEAESLRRLFSRDGFSDGYFTGDHKKMRGVRSFEDYLEMDKSPFGGLKRKEKASLSLTAKAGERASLTITTKSKSYTAEGDIVMPADTIAPLTEEGARKSCSRLGSTPFVLDGFEFLTDGNAALTLSAVNALRRDACEGILDISRKTPDLPQISFSKSRGKPTQRFTYTAEFISEEQISEKAKSFFEKIYLPFGAHSDNYGISLPPYMPDSAVEKLLLKCKGRSLLCHGLGQIQTFAGVAADTALSLRANAFNSACCEYFEKYSPEFLILAPEMKTAQMRDTLCPVPKGAAVYGRLPLMLTVRCAISDGDCKKKDKTEICRSGLCDRHGVRFPMLGMPDCTNIIYNSVPLYMADKKEDLQKAGLTHLHFIFTDESAAQVDRIINAYLEGTPPAPGMKIRRMN